MKFWVKHGVRLNPPHPIFFWIRPCRCLWVRLISGKATGLVSTARLTHATPAAAYAHTPNRRWESDYDIITKNVTGGCKDIALQMIEDNPNINVMYIEDIQMFGVNMTFISSSEVKKYIFHECQRHEWNIHFFTSREEIKVIFTTNIWIFFLLYTSLSIEEMQILHLQGEVWHAVLSLGGDI